MPGISAGYRGSCLTQAEEIAIVKFMQALTDGFEPPAGTQRLARGVR